MKSPPCFDCLVFVKCKCRVTNPEAPLELYQKIKNLVVNCKLLRDYFLEHPYTERRDGIICVIRWERHPATKEVISIFNLWHEGKQHDMTTYFDIRQGKKYDEYTRTSYSMY